MPNENSKIKSIISQGKPKLTEHKCFSPFKKSDLNWSWNLLGSHNLLFPQRQRDITLSGKMMDWSWNLDTDCTYRASSLLSVCSVRIFCVIRYFVLLLFQKPGEKALVFEKFQSKRLIFPPSRLLFRCVWTSLSSLIPLGRFMSRVDREGCTPHHPPPPRSPGRHCLPCQPSSRCM